MRLWATVMDWLGGISERSLSSERQAQQRKQRDVEPPREWELLRAAERDSIVASHLNNRLQPLGFVQVKPRLWVDGSAAPVRRVFEMVVLKGGAISPWWGYSLDFVPHRSGDRISWHRSNRTATFDVSFDLKDRRGYAYFCYGAAGLHHDLERVVPLALERAQETWRRGSTLSGILDIVREIREKRINSFYVFFRWHLPLTFMFLSAKVGDLTSAQAELKAYARDQELDEDVAAELSKLLQDAASIEDKEG
jgi:hypothetical protein